MRVSFYTAAESGPESASTSTMPSTLKTWLRLLAALVLLPLAWGGAALQAATPAADTENSEELAKRYEDARVAFEKGDFKKAQYLSESLLKDSLDKGKVSPQLFQLMGHTRYRQGDLGRAALWYMRAALFPPPSPETVQNLTHIRGKTGNLAFSANHVGDQYSSLLTRPQWMRIVVISLWAIVFSTVLCFVFRSAAARTLFLLLILLGLVGGSLGIIGWRLRPTFNQVKDLAIVTSPNAKSYTAASTTAGRVIDLPPGSQVRKLEERGAWTYVETWSGDPSSKDSGQMIRGWVQNDALSTFWPFDAKYLD
ncbi:hypothetical protein G5S37_11540 [Roseimicrobium sp. ORNL1]|nr:hypothetical protein G5S37_11540 [Roseimicrobium sp. ORNL1]